MAFDFLSTLFGGTSAADKGEGDEVPNVLKALPRIVAVLGRLKTAGATIKLRTEGSTTLYTSSILSVQPAERFLVLDEFMPRGTEHIVRELRAGRSLVVDVDAWIDGTQVTFRTTFIGFVLKAGVLYFKTAIPKQVSCLQRRELRRVKVPYMVSCPVRIVDVMDEPIVGMLRDVSEQGIGATLKYPPVIEWRVGGRLPKCTIELPGSLTISSPLEIRSIRKAMQGIPMRIGAEFVALDLANKRRLEKFATFLERESLRRKDTTDR